MHLHASRLPDAEGPVGGLVLYRRVPPAIEVEHVRGRCEVESGAAGPQREEKHPRPVRRREALHHPVAFHLGGATVKEHDFGAQAFGEKRAEDVPHFGELGKNQGPLADGEDFLHHLREPGGLAGATLDRSAVAQVVRRVIADLLQPRQHRENQSAASDPRRTLHRTQHLVQHCLIESRLFTREVAVHDHLQLLGEVADDIRVGLEAPQQERLHEPAQPLAAVRVAVALDGNGVAASEFRPGAKIARIQGVEDRPELRETVLQRGAGERHSRVGAQGAHGARLEGDGILQILCLVEDDPFPSHGPQLGTVAMGESVGRDDGVVVRGLLGEGVVPAAM